MRQPGVRRNRASRVLSCATLLLSPLLAWGAALPALGFDLEAGSLSNRLYVLINHPDTSASLTNLTIQSSEPVFISTLRPVFIPNRVPADGAAMAGFEFDVDPSAQLSASGTLVVTVKGTVASQVYTLQGPPPPARPEVSHDIALQIVNSAPANQGIVVGSVPGVLDIDSDRDGTPDLDEIANGTDPFDPDSGGVSGSGSAPVHPGDVGEAVGVPSLGAWALVLLVSLLTLLGVAAKYGRRDGRARQ